MKRNFIKYLVLFMGFSLVGLCFTQYYLLKEAYSTHKKKFSLHASNALYQTAKKIREGEKSYYDDILVKALDSLEASSKRSKIIGASRRAKFSKPGYVYSQRYVIEYIHFPVSEFNKKLKTILNSQSSELFYQKNQTLAGPNTFLFENIEIDQKKHTFDKETYARIIASHVPIERRIDPTKLQIILDQELREAGIFSSYEFMVLKADLSATSVKSKDYDVSLKDSSLQEDLFLDKSGEATYYLSLLFPEKTNTILTMSYDVILLSAGIILIILGIYAASLLYMGRQKKISDMKNDFINNITHEFKTPIATINIASDILKNPLASNDPQKVKYYADVVRKESDRLNTQVDMLLTMAKLEKNQLNLSFKLIDINVIAARAVDRVRLIVEHRKGVIVQDYRAVNAYILADLVHFENVILNILTNAEKYSPNTPFIKISTFSKENFAFIQIEDKGVGMPKEVLKKVFDPFFRVEGGNIHNVKGYGLGLSYSQKVVHLHKGIIFIESKDQKGTKCIVKMILK